MMKESTPNYYSERLNANKLQVCYEIAPPRIKQYLEAEIAFVSGRVGPNDTVLDLGCGYGRVAIRLAEKAKQVVGIDISKDNIRLAEVLYGKNKVLEFYEMDATQMAFPDDIFDITICVQNGISAFKADTNQLIKEALRVTKRGGILLFSSYSQKFWEQRLEWFRLQAEKGLIGEIDLDLSSNGVIVCRDGFRATTYSGRELLGLAAGFDVKAEIYEVDGSSVFCQMRKN